MARFYDPQIAHFISADTVVPEPGNLKSYDRYAYVNGNPVRFNDPSGHKACIDGNYCPNTLSVKTVLARFGVKLTNGTAQWNKRDEIVVMQAVVDSAIKLGATSNRRSVDAFRDYFNTDRRPLELRKMTYYTYRNNETGLEERVYSGAQTETAWLINVTQLAQPAVNRNNSLAYQLARNNIVHEFGHVFSYLHQNVTRNIPSELISDEGWPSSPESASLLWRQHPCSWDQTCIAGEVFSDMFLGWVYNEWGSFERATFMNKTMQMALSIDR